MKLQGNSAALTVLSVLFGIGQLAVDSFAQQTTQAPPPPLAPSASVYKLSEVAQKLAKAPEARGNFSTNIFSDWATGRAILLSFNLIKNHVHTDHSHVLYVIEGRAKFTIGSDVIEAGPGDVVTMPPNVPHKFEAVGSDPVRAFLVNVAGVTTTNGTWLE